MLPVVEAVPWVVIPLLNKLTPLKSFDAVSLMYDESVWNSLSYRDLSVVVLVAS